MGVEGSCGEDNLREASGGCNGAIEEDAATDATNAMQCFAPPLVSGDAESRNGRSRVD